MYTSKSSKMRRVSAHCTLLASVLSVNHAYAQQLEEVIVTAERKAESLQNVPIAVTAFTSDGVEALKLEDFEDLSLKIPGFSVNSFSKTRVNPALRGGSSSLSSAGAEQAVGLFIDDVYFGGSGDFELDLFDIERIEVLRGPQGTLFGRNTTGGLINVVTKDPSEEVEGKFKASLGNYSLKQLGAYMAGPLTDNLSASIAITSNKRDGTSKNTVTGNDVDDLNRSAFRGKLVWTPADDLEVKFALGYNTSDETGIARDAVSSRSTVDLEPLASQGFMIDDDPRKVQMFSDGAYESEQWVGSMHITKDFDAMTFQSITTARTFDADQDPVSLAGVPTVVYALADGRDTTSYTQEFRLISNADSALSWQAGVFFFDAEETRNLHAISVWDTSVVGGAFSSLFGCPDQTEEDFNNYAVTPVCIVNYPELFDENEYFIDETVKTTSISIYAQGTYDISPQLALTLGGRYTKDKKELNGVTSGEYEWFWNPTPGRVVDGVSEDWGEFTWKAVLDYKATDEILLYASASTGFRSGAFDMAQSDAALVDKAVDPETVISYELGAKTRVFDDRVQLNIAVFNTTYDDLQFFVNSVGSGGVSTTTNAGEASVEGVEVDLAWAVSDELIFSLGYSHQKGDSKDIPADAEIPDGTPPQGTVPNSYVAALDYTRVLAGGGEFYAHIDYLKKDEYSLEFIDNDTPQFRSKVDGQINANLGYRSKSGWSIQAWGKNLTDEEIVLYGQDFWFSLYNNDSVGANSELFNSSFGPRYTEPRTYGMTLSYEY